MFKKRGEEGRGDPPPIKVDKAQGTNRLEGSEIPSGGEGAVISAQRMLIAWGLNSKKIKRILKPNMWRESNERIKQKT